MIRTRRDIATQCHTKKYKKSINGNISYQQYQRHSNAQPIYAYKSKHRQRTNRIPNFDNLTDDGIGGPEKFHRNHFAEGSCRYAYAGKIVRGPRKGTLIVVKKWKSGHIYDTNFWNVDILCHKKAFQLISIWNSLGFINKKYRLSLPWISQCISSSNNCKDKNKIALNEWILCEEYLCGKFIKFNSNSGYVHLQYSNASVQAFCHWTYNYSKGKYIMCDVQGIRDKNMYKLTDPCLCSIHKGKYGVTDIGIKGIMSFFANHKCNEFCENDWIKPAYIDKRYVLKKKKSTTYQWQI